LIYQAKTLKKLVKSSKPAVFTFFEQSIMENQAIIANMQENVVFLVKPQLTYQKAFIDAVTELQALENDRYYVEKNLDVKQLSKKSAFKAYLKKISNDEAGIDLPANRVPQTIYWLMKKQSDGQMIWIGRVAIRHQLTDHLRKIGGHIGYVVRPRARRQGYGSQLLALSLEKISQGQPELDTDQALLTCDETNLGSKKIIENNGGIFFAYTEQEAPLPRKLLYWVPYTLGKIG
jgi:predicted acetyltransferase